jgi:hypothetical protein
MYLIRCLLTYAAFVKIKLTTQWPLKNQINNTVATQNIFDLMIKVQLLQLSMRFHMKQKCAKLTKSLRQLFRESRKQPFLSRFHPTLLKQ